MEVFNEKFLDSIINIPDERMDKINELNDNQYLCRLNINEQIAYLLYKYTEAENTNYIQNVDLHRLAKKFLKYFSTKNIIYKGFILTFSCTKDEYLLSKALAIALNKIIIHICEIQYDSQSFSRRIYLCDNGLLYYMDEPSDQIGIFAYNLQDFFIKIFEIPINFMTQLTVEDKYLYDKFYNVLDELENS